MSASRQQINRTSSSSRKLETTSISLSLLIVSKAFDISIPSRLISCLYFWHKATYQQCANTTSVVERPAQNPLWVGAKYWWTFGEIRFRVIRESVFGKVVSSTMGLRLVGGPKGVPGFWSGISIPLPMLTGWCCSNMALNIFVSRGANVSRPYFNNSPGMSSSPAAHLLLSHWRLLNVSATVIGVDNGLGCPTKQDSLRTPDVENCAETWCCIIHAASLSLPTIHPSSSVITGFIAIFCLMSWTALNILAPFSCVVVLWLSYLVDFSCVKGFFPDFMENLIACFL